MHEREFEIGLAVLGVKWSGELFFFFFCLKTKETKVQEKIIGQRTGGRGSVSFRAYAPFLILFCGNFEGCFSVDAD